MTSAQKKNFIIKTIIVVIVLAAVSVYMFTMRAKAANSEGDGEETAQYITFHFNGQELVIENQGEFTELPPAPKMPMNFFVGWYTGDETLYTPGENAGKSIDVYAKFMTFESVVSNFIGNGEYTPDGLDYVFELQNEAVIIQNKSFHNHPFTNQKCRIVFDIFAGSGTLILQLTSDTSEIEFKISLDYSNLDYSDITKGISVILTDLQIISLESGTVPFENAKNAILYLSGDIASAVEKLIRHIANVSDYRY